MQLVPVACTYLCQIPLVAGSCVVSRGQSTIVLSATYGTADTAVGHRCHVQPIKLKTLGVVEWISIEARQAEGWGFAAFADAVAAGEAC